MKQSKHCHPVVSSCPGGRRWEWSSQARARRGLSRDLIQATRWTQIRPFFQAGGMMTMLVTANAY